MAFWDLHVPVYNFSPAFSASLCGLPKDSAAEMINVLFFLSSDAAALGPWPLFHGSQSCTEQRNWVTSVERPQGSSWWPCFLPSQLSLNCHLCPFSGNSGLRERSAIQWHLLGSSLPQVISAHSSLHPWKKRDGFSSLLLRTPITRLLCYSFVHDCDFSMGFFFFLVTFLSWK